MPDSILRQQAVRDEIEKLRNADDAALAALNKDSIHRRLRWFHENKGSFDFLRDAPLESAYRLLLARFRISAGEAPIVRQTDKQIVFHSQNFCPTLEACKILGLDTRTVCKRLNEDATDRLIKQIDPRLRFSRNYEILRPYASCCEEMIGILD
jgi:hypothetical protein